MSVRTYECFLGFFNFNCRETRETENVAEREFSGVQSPSIRIVWPQAFSESMDDITVNEQVR
jgi:hypothetical protein